MLVRTALILSIAHSISSSLSQTEPPVTRMAFVLVAPALQNDSVSSLPKVMFLAGANYARIDQPADAKSATKNAIIVNQRDIWLIDGLKKIGTHSVNRNMDFSVHNPILGPGCPADLLRLEYGRELDFFQETGGKKVAPKLIRLVSCEGREIEVDDYRVSLWVDPKTGLPAELGVVKAGKSAVSVHYLQYEVGLPFDLALFEVPQDIHHIENSGN